MGEERHHGSWFRGAMVFPPVTGGGCAVLPNISSALPLKAKPLL